MVKVKAYAKINLALEVMDLIDGYHKVNNLMRLIDLYDEIIVEEDKDVYVVDDLFPDNLCVKAAKMFLDFYHINNGVKITLNKNIPAAAGLAGGSTDAAAVLLGLKELYNVNAKTKDLLDMAANLGSDVPFFIEMNTALCVNRGEIVHPVNDNLDEFSVLLVKPNVGLSTKLVYQNYVYDNKLKTKEIDNLVTGLKNNDYELLKNNIFNDLEKVSLSICPELNELYSKIKNMGYSVHVSGSGPTMFVLDCDKNDYLKIKDIINKDDFIYLTKSFRR